MSENYSQPILNPNIYLNYLQPTVASEYEAARNVFLVTFGVNSPCLVGMVTDWLLQALLWDIISSLPDDWILIWTMKPSPALFAYFSSR